MTPRHPRRDESGSVAALADQFGLAPADTERLARLAGLLAEDPFAPTTIRDPARVLRDHLADSLVALELEVVARAGEVADLGSGPGLPGLCLAIALPAATVHLVESNARKCQFLADAVETLELANVEIVNRRVEEWVEGTGRCDLVTARALASAEVVLEYAAPLLVPGGHLVAWRGQDGVAPSAATERAAEQVGLEIERSVPVAPYPGSEHRHLLVAAKRRPTPARYPRRPGMAVKRPLGAG